MLGQKRNDSLFGPGSRTIEAPQSVLEKQEAALEGSPLDEAVQPPFESQTPVAAFTDADDLPRRTNSFASSAVPPLIFCNHYIEGGCPNRMCE